MAASQRIRLLGRLVLEFAGLSLLLRICAAQQLPQHGLSWHAAFWVLLPWLFLRRVPAAAADEEPTPVRTAANPWLKQHLPGLVLSGCLVFWASASWNLTLHFLIGAMIATLALEMLWPVQAADAIIRILRRMEPTVPHWGAVLGPPLILWLFNRLAFGVEIPLYVYGVCAAVPGGCLYATRRLSSSPGRWLLAQLATSAVLAWFLSSLVSALQLGALLGVIAGISAVPLALPARHCTNPGESVRRWILLLCGLWLMAPILTLNGNGSGDAYWYTLVQTDFIQQFRAGVFLPFVGQSEYAFSGSVFPGRYAPYFQYCGIMVDTLTGHTLSPFAIAHVTLGLSFLGGLFAAYGVLVILAPTQRWAAVLVALLYAASPVWLSALYGMDMYMTFMTLPWLPCAWLGAIRSFVRLDARTLAWIVLPLSITWYAHTPIALWMTMTLIATQLLRMLLRWQGWRREAGWNLAAAGLFILLTSFPFVSAYYTDRATDDFRVNYVVKTMAEQWWLAWNPVSREGALPSDQHLGWGLILLALGSIAFGWRNGGRAGRVLVLLAAGLFLLITPIPGLQAWIWQNLPSEITGITNNWPVQRIYPVLSAILTLASGLMLLRTFRQRPRLARMGLFVLTVAAGWSASEAAKFRRRGSATTLDEATSVRRFHPENIVLTRYSYEMFPVKPDYLSHGYMDPWMENRLLARENLAVLAENETAEAGCDRQDLMLQPRAESGGLLLASPLILQPGRRYRLTFHFPEPELHGSLQITGERLWHEYILPHNGGKDSFGSPRDQRRTLTLWTSGESPETVQLRYLPQVHKPPASLGRLTVETLDPTRLPVQVTSWIPFRSEVRSPLPAWLETPRMHSPGYQAVVNGRPAEVGRSPQGLVMVGVPAGTSQVELRFAGPWLLRLAFWSAALAWVGTVACLFLTWKRTSPTRLLR